LKIENKFNDRIKVLGYGDLDKLKNLMDQHFFGQLSAVSDEITSEPRTIFELNNYIENGNFTHVIVPDEHFHNLEGVLKGCKVPVVELLLDHWVPWAVERKMNYIRENGIKEVIVFSERFLEVYGDVATFHRVLCGYDLENFVDKQKEREIDILINGSLGEDTHKWVYPVRNWLANVLPKIGDKECLNVVVHSHPGYVSRGEYAEHYLGVLNKSKIAIGGSSHWRLPLKKFYEIPACGTILLSDLPLEDTDFFRGRIMEVNPNKILNTGYEDVVRGKIVDVLSDYENSRKVFQPFRSEQDRFDKSYQGRALEMRKIISTI